MPVNVFSPGAIQTAYVQYASYVLTTDGGNIILTWPTSYLSNPYVAPLFLAIDNSADAMGVGVYMPNATFASVGQNMILQNSSSNSFILYKYDGTVLSNIAGSSTNYIILTDNTTQGGTWDTFIFAAGTIPVNVSALAGYGLTTLAADSYATLNTDISTVLVNASTYSVVLSDWAKTIIGTASSGQTITLPAASTPGLVDGFYVYIANVPSSGALSISPGAGTYLNNNPTSPPIAVAAGQSVLIIYDTSGSTPVYWSLAGSGAFTGILPIANGGTGANTRTAAFTNLAPAPTTGALMYSPDGVSWQDLAAAASAGSSLVASAASGFPPAWNGLSILQIVSLNITSCNTTGYTNTTPATLTTSTPTVQPMSLNLTPSSVNSKVFLFVNVNISASSAGTGGRLIFLSDGDFINIGNGSVFTTTQFLPSETMVPYSMFYIDTPVTTATLTYTIQAATNDGSVYFFNTNVEGPGTVVGSSNFIAVEVGGF